MRSIIDLDGDSLTLEELSRVAAGDASVSLAPRDAEPVDAARAVNVRAV